MIRQLYRLLPASIRTKIYLTVFEQVKSDEARRAKGIEATLPHVELGPEHIRNLRVLIDRDAFLSVLPKHSVVAEVGVARGDFSERILSISKPTELHLIDSWVHDERYIDLRKSVEDRFEREIALGRVHVHRGFSIMELAEFDSQYFDWVYIDTSHDYDTTAKELEICRNKVKRGGFIAGHDYVTGAWLDRIRFGVIEAVNEFCVKYNWEMTYLTHERHRHLSYALKQILP
jgi:hypothetical protein